MSLLFGRPSGIKKLRPALAIVLVVVFAMPVAIIAFGELIEGVLLLVYMLVISAILGGLAYWTLRPQA